MTTLVPLDVTNPVTLLQRDSLVTSPQGTWSCDCSYVTVSPCSEMPTSVGHLTRRHHSTSEGTDMSATKHAPDASRPSHSLAGTGANASSNDMPWSRAASHRSSTKQLGGRATMAMDAPIKSRLYSPVP
jgi:hypothetical protein